MERKKTFLPKTLNPYRQKRCKMYIVIELYRQAHPKTLGNRYDKLGAENL